jgi:hypothetical protein
LQKAIASVHRPADGFRSASDFSYSRARRCIGTETATDKNHLSEQAAHLLSRLLKQFTTG